MEVLFECLNNSKLFTGCMMMFMNVGSRYIVKDLPKSLDQIFDNIWIRRFVIFCIAFIATHDIKISILITLASIILFTYLLNENSKCCILPEHFAKNKQF